MASLREVVKRPSIATGRRVTGKKKMKQKGTDNTKSKGRKSEELSVLPSHHSDREWQERDEQLEMGRGGRVK